MGEAVINIFTILLTPDFGIAIPTVKSGVNETTIQKSTVSTVLQKKIYSMTT